MWTLALVMLTVTWFLLPLVPAWREWRHKTDVLALEVLPEHAGEVGHFAQRFRERMGLDSGALPTAGDGPVQAFRPNLAESGLRRVRRMLVADADLSLPTHFTFEREVYGRHNIRTGPHSIFHALLAEGSLQIAAGCTVWNWAHARHIEAGPACRLHGRLSASDMIVLQPECRFERVSAGLVCFGSRHDMRPLPAATDLVQVWTMPESARSGEGRWRLDGDFELPAHAKVHGDIIVQGRVCIRRGARLHGSLKGAGTVCLEDGVVVTGAVISGGRLTVGDGCQIAGPVVAEESVDLGGGSCVGQPARPCTVSAPVMRVGVGVQVYGTVWARRQGSVHELADGAR